MTRQVGITGGIGAGKSIVCQIFSALGVPVYAADVRAKYIIEHDASLKKQIVELLGPRAYLANGDYDRAWVAAQVFNNQHLLQNLNELVHPRVFEDTNVWAAKHQHQPYVLKEAAIMNKRAGDGNALHKIILVTAPLALRLDRIGARDPQRSAQQILDIIERQMPDEKRQLLADYVIVNDQRRPLIDQVLALDAVLRNA